MAEHHGLDGAVGNYGRCGRSPVQHADLAEEVTGTQPGGRLAGARDLHVAALQDEEGLGRLSLADQRLTRLETDLIDATGHELEVAFRDSGEKRHASQPIDLRIRHVENIQQSPSPVAGKAGKSPSPACGGGAGGGCSYGAMAGTVEAERWPRSISITHWKTGVKQSTAMHGGRLSSS